MALSIILTPAVVLANRRRGQYGIAEVINLSCRLTGGSTIAGYGGVRFRLNEGGGVITAANHNAGTATFTASAHPGPVKIAAYGLNNDHTVLARATLFIVAPSSLSFVKISNIHHTHNAADAGFRGRIKLLPSGVSFQNLLVREGSFTGKGTGYYAIQDKMIHPASAAGIRIINGNQVNGLDTIYSGIQGTPWSDGRFDWYIPWQYQVVGTAGWTTFAYANHVQTITTSGVVSIGKFNSGRFTAKPSDPDQNY